jgi:hypothetical protein
MPYPLDLDGPIILVSDDSDSDGSENVIDSNSTSDSSDRNTEIALGISYVYCSVNEKSLTEQQARAT